MKRAVALLLAVSMMLGLTACGNTKDEPKQETKKEEVVMTTTVDTDIAKLLNDTGIYTEPSSEYNTPVTRGEFASYMSRIISKVYKIDTNTDDIKFTDTDEKDIKLAAKYGIISGYPDGSFKPDSPISREEAAVLFTGILQAIDYEITFSKSSFGDEKDFEPWALEPAQYVVSLGAITTQDGKFFPKENITKGQMVNYLERLLFIMAKSNQQSGKELVPVNKKVEAVEESVSDEVLEGDNVENNKQLENSEESIGENKPLLEQKP